MSCLEGSELADSIPHAASRQCIPLFDGVQDIFDSCNGCEVVLSALYCSGDIPLRFVLGLQRADDLFRREDSFHDISRGDAHNRHSGCPAEAVDCTRDMLIKAKLQDRPSSDGGLDDKAGRWGESEGSSKVGCFDSHSPPLGE